MGTDDSIEIDWHLLLAQVKGLFGRVKGPFDTEPPQDETENLYFEPGGES
jgi:hypothetical protein